MARGGGGRGRRTYVRDGNGRFASTPGGGKPKVTGGTLTARTRARKSRQRLAAQNPSDRTIQGSLSRRSQKGAVTRGQKALAASRQANRMTVRGAGAKGVVRKGGKGKVGTVVKAGVARPPRQRLSREGRLALAALRAQRLAGQRKEQSAEASRKAQGMRLDAYALKSKKKTEAALQSPDVRAAAVDSQRRDSQRGTADRRASALREAYFRQLGQGKGEKGKVAAKDRKRYDALRSSAYRLGQEISRDGHNLAYNTNSMGYKEQVRTQTRFDLNRRRMQRMQALIKRLANVSSVSEAPTLQRASATGRRVKRAALRPGPRSNTNRSSVAFLVQSMPYIVRRNGRTMGSINPEGRIDKIKAERAGGPSRLRKPKPKPAKPVSMAGRGRVVYRTRSQAIASQRARSNALGRKTADQRGFNAVTAANFGKRRGSRDYQTFYDSAPRTVIGRPRVSQMTLSGRTERVGAGRFRTIGERRSSGSVSRPRKVKPSPIRGSKSYQREVQRLIRQNGGKDVAAFHL